MRIGLIADIHGNVVALREALAALGRHDVDRALCLGDVASPGPWPAETIALLAEREIPAVLGNTDEWLLADDPGTVSDTPAMNAVNAWAATRLDAGAMAWLAELPLLRSLEIEGTPLSLYHGSPRGTEEVIAAVTPRKAITRMLDGIPPGLAIGGHTHIQMLRVEAAWTLVNPGSVGLGGTGPGTPDLPPTRPASAAEMAVLEIAAGVLSIEYLHLPLDVPAMIEAARQTGMPALAWWASLWNASR